VAENNQSPLKVAELFTGSRIGASKELTPALETIVLWHLFSADMA
jgi:hypothetical protein